MPHDKTKAQRVPGMIWFHTKQYTALFRCPVCSREGRFNLNWLSNRKVFCDGTKFTKEHEVGE